MCSSGQLCRLPGWLVELKQSLHTAVPCSMHVVSQWDRDLNDMTVTFLRRSRHGDLVLGDNLSNMWLSK